MGATEDLGPLSWGVTIAFFAICTVSFALRVYSHSFLKRSFTWDDRLMAIAFGLLIGQQYICWKWLSLGGGKHVQAVTFEELRKMRLYQFIDQFYYYAVQLFIRLSFLVFFHRTLYTPRLSTSIRIVALVVLLQTIGTWIFYALQCRPLSAFFHPHGNPNAACISSRITYTAPNAVNAAINLLIYILPIPTLVGKAPQEIIRTTAVSPQPPRPSSNAVSSPEPPKSPEPETLSSRSTAATIALFTMGGLGVTASFLRIAVLHHWSTAASTDYPYALALVAIVTTVELCLYITCSNLPSLRRSSATSTDGGGNERHELRSRRRRRRNRRGGGGGGHESEDELWGVSEGKGITITSRVSISITEALRGAQGAQRDGVPYYPKKYFKFARPGTRSPTPNLLKELEG